MTSVISRNLPLALPPARAEILHPAAYRQNVEWQDAAICRQADPELFFPVGSTGRAVAEIQRAKAVCASCPVQQPCLTYALATSQEFGIWGGRDENERRLLHRQWRQSCTAASTERLRPDPGAEQGVARIGALP